MIVHTDWLLTAQRLAIHLPTGTAVVADLDLGYNDCRRRSGEAVPLSDLKNQLEPLGRALKKQGVTRLVIAGDLFEAGFCPDLAKQIQQWLAGAAVDWAALVPGNHDRALDHSFDSVSICPDGIMLDRWRVLHGNEKLPSGPTVHGHVHPSVSRHGRKVPCFLVGPNRLVLPAYSQDAAGVNITKDPAWYGYRCCAIDRIKLIDFGTLPRQSAESGNVGCCVRRSPAFWARFGYRIRLRGQS
jgi:metallophosphoesterase superfamily enzyme